jgi:hypothetical protein
MEVIEIVIPYKISQGDFHLYDLSDLHVGTIHCAEEKIRHKVQDIKNDKNAMWIGGGDYGDFITPKDKRWNHGQISDWVKQHDIGESVRNYLVELLDPIKDKCIGLLYGNHEASYSKQNDNDVHQHICKDMGVPNLGYSCFAQLKFQRENSAERHTITGAFTHGTGNAITEGAKVNNLMRFMKAFRADIYGYSHVHDYIPKSLTRLYATDSGKITNKVSIGATTGCWFRTYTQGPNSSYGEEKVYPPTEMCCAMFIINPTTGFLDVSRSV